MLLRTGLALVTLSLLAGGCGRWMDYAPVRLRGRVNNPQVVYYRLARRAQAMGYILQSADPARRHFVVLAQLDQRKRKAHLKTSFFHVVVRRNAAVDVTAHGFHFRRGGTLIHRKLCHELTMFLDGMAAELDPSRPPVLVGMR
jgi:hypothetical protein